LRAASNSHFKSCTTPIGHNRRAPPPQKDLSPTGIAIAGMDNCFVGQLIKLESEFLNAIAQVKNREAVGDSSTQVRVGLKFLAVSFNLPRGTFVGITV